MFEVQNGEPPGDEGPRLGSRLIDDQVVGTGEELFGLAQAAGVDERTSAVPEGSTATAVSASSCARSPTCNRSPMPS